MRRFSPAQSPNARIARVTKREAASWWRSRLEGEQPWTPAAQVSFVERVLALEPRSRVLDLGCGSGRQTLELARRGHRVLGLDAAETPLAEARAAARQERLNVHFLKSDSRQIPYRNDFDAVVCLSTAFGLLPSERDDQKVLESVVKALKAGGHLLLDLVNKEWLMRHFEPQFWEQASEGRGDVVLDRFSFNFETGRLDNHRMFVGPTGERTPSFVSQRVYTLTEIKSALARVELEYKQVWGGFDGGPYGMDTPRMIVLAAKPHAQAKRARPDDELPAAIRIKGRRKSR
jgi:SAM-dependent methyltransferase